MTGRRNQRLLIAVSVMVLTVFAAAVAAGAASSPAIDKTEFGIDATPEAVIVGPTGVTPVVYVATGLDFPDALGAGPVAGITDAPILLVAQNSIPAPTQAELTRLAPDRIVIVGGTGVISAGVESALGAYAATVERRSGADRYATAADVSAANFPAPHTFIVYDTSSATTEIGSTCTNYDDLMLPIAVPGPGTIIVEANIQLYIDHVVQASLSLVNLYIGTSTVDCTGENGIGGDQAWIFMAKEPAGDYFPWVTMKKVMHVDSAGTHKFYATGVEASGTDTPYFYFAFMDATFIPDPGT